MTTYRIEIDYTSKYFAEIEADTAEDAALRAMRALKQRDPESGPVGYRVFEGDRVVADRRAWGPKKRR